MNFIDDINLEASSTGTNAHVGSQLPNFIDAPVAGAVDFQHIDVVASGNLTTDVALPARCIARALDAVEGFGQNACRGGLTHTTRPREQIRMTDAVGRDGVLQRLGHGGLSDKFGKRLGAVAACDDDIFAASSGISGGGIRAIGHGDCALECDSQTVSNVPARPFPRATSDPRTRVHRLGLLRLRPDPVHGSPSQGPLVTRRTDRVLLC